MRAEELFQRLAEVLYTVILLAVLVQAVRRPLRANFDVALFFGATGVIVALSALLATLRIPTPAAAGTLEAVLLMALPYLLLRLVADFMDVPIALLRGAEVGLVLAIAVLVLVPSPLPLTLTLALVAYFVGVSLYASSAFVRGARRSGGVTRRRLQAVALGSLFLALDILVAGVGAAMPDQSAIWGMLGPLFGMASGIAYLLGFAPPTWLRRAWQEPELRAFLGRAATLPHMPNTQVIVAELERGAAAALGASGATIGLWNGDADTLLFYEPGQGQAGEPLVSPHHEGVQGAFVRTERGWRIAGDARAPSSKALREQRALFFPDVARDDPVNGPLYAAYGSKAALAAPITAGDQRLGALVVYAARSPIFADSDLELVQLLADQSAVILESRKLLDAAAQAQARTETARLKEDFLSSAAHDLKTPLAGILTQAQVLLKRMELRPHEQPDPTGLQRIVHEARRLSALIRELLDVSRLEQGRLVETLESVDLVEVARAVCARHTRGPLQCRVDASDAVVGSFDPVRIRQLLDHLVDNAAKFSKGEGDVSVRVWRDEEQARLDVVDQGIGIPREDFAHLFERFYRGSNVDDRRFAGLGLGLYISRGIAEQHGGRVWATSSPQGTTVSVGLPLRPSPVPEARAPVSSNGEPAHA